MVDRVRQVQQAPVCFACHQAIDSQPPVYEATCGHPECPSVCWHPACLMEFRAVISIVDYDALDTPVRFWHTALRGLRRRIFHVDV